jgi:hypothetical protein
MTQKTETKNSTRDLMEYILLISFVCVGSSYVVVTEFQAAQSTKKDQSNLQLVDSTKLRQPHSIFGQQTKRHIK